MTDDGLKEQRNDETLVQLYDAFNRRDAAKMVDLYHADATFEDPVFGKLARSEIEKMWMMLCERGKDLRIELNEHHADATTGFARWTATYTFSTTGRLVRNVVQSRFRFDQGRIIEQRDNFDLWRWTSMALGAAGRVLGWSPLVRGKVRRQARASLDEYATDSSSVG